jgi:hypothetical protein
VSQKVVLDVLVGKQSGTKDCRRIGMRQPKLRSQLGIGLIFSALFAAVCVQPVRAEPAATSLIEKSWVSSIPDGWSGDFIWTNSFGGGTKKVSMACRAGTDSCVLQSFGSGTPISFSRTRDASSVTKGWKDAANVYAVSDVVWAMGSDFSADPGWAEGCKPWPECASTAKKIDTLWILSNVSGVPVEPWTTSEFGGLRLGENLGTNSRSTISNVRFVMTLFYEEGRFNLYAVWGGATDKDCTKDASRCLAIGVGEARTETISQKPKWNVEVSPSNPTVGKEITVKLTGGCGRPVSEAIGLSGPSVSFEIQNVGRKTPVRAQQLDETTVVYSWSFKSQKTSRIEDGKPIYEIKVTVSPRGVAGAKALCIDPNKDTTSLIKVVATEITTPTTVAAESSTTSSSVTSTIPFSPLRKPFIDITVKDVRLHKDLTEFVLQIKCAKGATYVMTLAPTDGKRSKVKPSVLESFACPKGKIGGLFGGGRVDKTIAIPKGELGGVFEVFDPASRDSKSLVLSDPFQWGPIARKAGIYKRFGNDLGAYFAETCFDAFFFPEKLEATPNDRIAFVKALEEAKWAAVFLYTGPTVLEILQFPKKPKDISPWLVSQLPGLMVELPEISLESAIDISSLWVSDSLVEYLKKREPKCPKWRR